MRFLFTLVANSLSQVINKGVSRGLISGFTIGLERIMVSRLQYADDTLVLVDDSRTGLRILRLMIECVEMASGLAVNWEKSQIMGIGFDQSKVSVVGASLMDARFLCSSQNI